MAIITVMPTARRSAARHRRSAQMRRRRLVTASVVTGVLLVTVWACGSDGRARPAQTAARVAVPAPTRSSSSSVARIADRRAVQGLPLTPAARAGRGHLAPGSDPRALPGPLLIADKKNNRLLIVDPQGRIRWSFPRRGDLRPGQTFRIPDDAFFTPDGRHIIATQEDDYVVSIIDIATHRITWRYGAPGVPGSGPNRLDNPDDAMLLPGGRIVAGDIKNCRIIAIRSGRHALAWSAGQVGSCYHAPPYAYGSPNGMFPTRDGHFLVTEINGDWVDEISPTGRVLWSTHPPGVSYPSDTNSYGPDSYLTVDYSSPGQVLLFNRAGQLLWRYAPSGSNALNKPSLAMRLPNGNIVVNDDANHRVIVIDRRTHRIVWQYGHLGVAGSAPGYLDNPDGLDLLPPLSYVDRVS